MTTPNELIEKYNESNAWTALSYANKVLDAYRYNQVSKIWKIYKQLNDAGDSQGRDGAYAMAEALGIKHYLEMPPIVLSSYDSNAEEDKEISYDGYEDHTSLILSLKRKRRYQVKVYTKNEDEEIYIPFEITIKNQHAEYVFDNYDEEIHNDVSESIFHFTSEEGVVQIDIRLTKEVDEDTEWFILIETA